MSKTYTLYEDDLLSLKKGKSPYTLREVHACCEDRDFATQ